MRPAGLAIIGAIVAAFFLAPYAVMFLSALKFELRPVPQPGPVPADALAMGNFASVWKMIPPSYLGNSLIIAAVSTVIVLLVSLPAQPTPPPGTTSAASAPSSTCPGDAGSRGWRWSSGYLPRAELVNGAVNSYWAIIAVDAAFNLAFSIWI